MAWLRIGKSHVCFAPRPLTAKDWKPLAPMSSIYQSNYKHEHKQNHLLAAMSDAEFDRLAGHLELVPILIGDVLYESGAVLPYVYFPTTAIVSLHSLLKNGGSTEIASLGNEGALGVSLFKGGNTSLRRAVVQTGGYAYRIQSHLMMEEFNRAGSVMHLCLRYIQALITHVSQTAVCNRHHSVVQQLCRWLLHTLDHLPSNELTVTQQTIATMLGVCREGVTAAPGTLQSDGDISCRRGHITVLNRAGLEAMVCECYALVKIEFTRLLPDMRQL